MTAKWDTGVIRFRATLCRDGWLVEGYINGSDPVLSYVEPGNYTVERVADGSRYKSIELFRQWHEATVNTTEINIT